MARLLALVACVAVSLSACARREQRETELEAILARGEFTLIAEAAVGGHCVRVFQDSDESGFGPLVLVARDEGGQLLDFCLGTIRSSSEPFARSERYCALVAAIESSGDHIFVYESTTRRFTAHALPPLVSHVHEGLLIRGDVLLFSTCKSPEPVWMLELNTGEFTSLGRDTPQGAEFGLRGSTVLVMGETASFELDGKELKPTTERAPAADGLLQQFRIATR